jgi:hypothetical protein
MRGKRFLFCAVVLFGGVLMMASSALAAAALGCSDNDGENSSCIQDAKGDYQLCVKECRLEFLNSWDICNLPEPPPNQPPCDPKPCTDAFKTCIQNLQVEPLIGCRTNCKTEAEEGIQWCGKYTKPNSRARKRCLDFVQRSASRCENECNQIIVEEMTQCREDFNTCLTKTCPPTPTPN